MAKIAFLGAGSMGSAMVTNYLKGGHQVTVYNRTLQKARPLEALGATLATTPREAAAGAEVIISCLINDDASRASWIGPNGALHGDFKPGAFAIEASTTSVDWVKELSELARAKGLRFLDCPVAGRPDLARAGKLKVFAGGPVEDVDAMRPILASISAAVIHFGPVGAGLTFKLIYNVMGALQVAATAEGMAACEAAGIDLKVAADAFSTGATGQPACQAAFQEHGRRYYRRPDHVLGKEQDQGYQLRRPGDRKPWRPIHSWQCHQTGVGADGGAGHGRAKRQRTDRCAAGGGEAVLRPETDP